MRIFVARHVVTTSLARFNGGLYWYVLLLRRCFCVKYRRLVCGAWTDIYLVYGQLKHIIEHSGQQSFKNFWRLLDTRVCIALDQENVEVAVKNIIEPKQLEAEFALSRIQLLASRIKASCSVVLHLRQDEILKVTWLTADSFEPLFHVSKA